MNNQVAEIEINDLSDVAVDLTDEELQAVSGARMSVSWHCGSRGLADEWDIT